MTKDIKLNECKFKIIKDQKDEPDLKAAQKFVGGYVEGITFPNGDYLIINTECVAQFKSATHPGPGVPNQIQ